MRRGFSHGTDISEDIMPFTSTTDSGDPDGKRIGTLSVGCPVWACTHWRGSLFTARAARADWLLQYSSVFRTVECNSTFYGLPSAETVRRWSSTAADGFRFSLKFPRAISHDRRLVNAGRETNAFLEVAGILHEADRLGPSFLQLPPDFGPDQFDVLTRYLKSLPSELPWAVEVRHFGWFDNGAAERQLDSLLCDLGIDKVLFDSRPLYSAPPADDAEAVSQTRKPRTPVRRTVTARHPFLRIVGRNNVDEALPWIEEWAPVTAEWLERGLSPFIFAHAPDDRFAPEFARRFLAAVQKYRPETVISPWPGETERAARRVQRTLF